MIKIRIANVFVDDQARAEKFYTEVLGFTKAVDVPVGKHRFLTVASPEEPNGTQLLLEPNESPVAQNYQAGLRQLGAPAIVLEVDDIDREHKRLTNLGVRFPSNPAPLGPVTAAILDDGCGNLIQLVQP